MTMTRRRLIALSLAVLASGLVAAAPAEFRLPYEPAEIRSRQDATQAAPIRCPALVPPPRQLTHASRYRSGDPSASEIDPQRKAAEEVAAKPVRDFNRILWSIASRFLREPHSASHYANCLLSHLDHWAEGGALTGDNSFQGQAEQKWTSVAASLAYLDVRGFVDPDRSRRIESWLNQVGHEVRRRYSVPVPSSIFSSVNNNHAYWAALSTAAIGTATTDAALFDWGMSRFRRALDDIDDQGLLRQELRRGALALQYHRFALEPLLLLRHFARANGVPVDDTEDAALRRLVHSVQAGMLDPVLFVERTGKPQAGPFPALPHQWAWGELAVALWEDPPLEARIAPLRPFSHVWLGGDLTLRYRQGR